MNTQVSVYEDSKKTYLYSTVIDENKINNNYFKEYMNYYSGLIIYLSRKYDIFNRMEREDILQEGYFILWDALNKYDDTKKASFDSYFTMRIEKHFLNIRKHMCCKKKRGLTVTIDKEIGEGLGVYFKDILQDSKAGVSFEDIYFNDYINYIFEEFSFTNIEAQVLKNVIYYRELGYYRVSPILEKEYGIAKKTVDNALTRIRKKLPIKYIIESDCLN
ncbi:MAG: hypothetical protein K9L17_02165 [Clostridiales bacterium]|nr:hypothetical protein [Clostridiales bacterium]MCF8021489.1 hypothetical protein [Clostridiales bacterium]